MTPNIVPWAHSSAPLLCAHTHQVLPGGPIGEGLQRKGWGLHRPLRPHPAFTQALAPELCPLWGLPSIPTAQETPPARVQFWSHGCLSLHSCPPSLPPLLSLTYYPFPLLAGEHLRICPQGYTCCTSEMEENLANRSRAELETALLDSSRTLQATLAAQLRSFDGEWAPGLRDRRTRNEHPGGAQGVSLGEVESEGDGGAL